MGDQIVGGLVTLGIGVVAVAVIFQLSSKGGNALATTGAGVVNNTTTSLFKTQTS